MGNIDENIEEQEVGDEVDANSTEVKNKNKETNISNRTSILESVMEKTAVAILTGLTLALLNHYFWEKKEEARRSELYLQNKIETYSETSRFFTLLIATHNQIATLRERNHDQLTKLNPDDKDRLNKLKEATTEAVMGLSKQFTHANIYFSHETVDKLRSVQRELAKHSTGESKRFLQESPIVKDIMDLSRQMGNEVREEFQRK